MSQSGPAAIDVDAAAALLGVGAGATDDALRAAYLAQVRLYPPDRDPERFEQVRDAYALLRDPNVRARQVLQSPPAIPLSAILEGTESSRRFAGPAPWLAVLKENRS